MRSFPSIIIIAVLVGCTGTTTEIREHVALGTRPSAYRGSTVAVLPFGGPNGPVARDVVVRVLAEQDGANVVSPSQVDSFLWNAKLEPSAYDPNVMAAISAGVRAPVVIWGQVDQFTPYHFDRFVPATPAYVEMTINTWSAAGGTKTATINKQGSLPFTIWDKQPTFQDVLRRALELMPEDKPKQLLARQRRRSINISKTKEEPYQPTGNERNDHRHQSCQQCRGICNLFFRAGF